MHTQEPQLTKACNSLWQLMGQALGSPQHIPSLKRSGTSASRSVIRNFQNRQPLEKGLGLVLLRKNGNLLFNRFAKGDCFNGDKERKAYIY